MGKDDVGGIQPPQQATYGVAEREEVAEFIPHEARSALDVGCSEGGFGSSLRKALGNDAHLVGVEAMPKAAARALELGSFDEVVAGYFPEVLAGRDQRFDLITFNDVLEHMYAPQEALEAARDMLTPNGQVLACIPNVQYAPVVWSLLRGRWDYTSHGVLDRTHVRFFTRQTMVEMFESSGYRVTLARGVNSLTRQDPVFWRGHRRKLRHLLRDAEWMQFIIMATPGHPR